MSAIWFTADLHLGHANILKYSRRLPFLNEQEGQWLAEGNSDFRVSRDSVLRHDAGLLDAINAVVRPDDVLWILGDFCWGDFHDARRYRERIHCENVNLVWGNHDRREIGVLFRETMEQGMVRADGERIWLNHYPMRSWDRSFHGSWHLYGHVHGRLQAQDDAMPWLLARDVGVDCCDYRPLGMPELRAYMAPRVEQFQKHRSAEGPSGVS